MPPEPATTLALTSGSVVLAALPYFVSGFFAGILTYCDLDAVFNGPTPKMNWWPRLNLRVLWWGFVIANSGLAALLLFVLNSQGYFKNWNQWVAAVLIGFSYTALVRLKLTSIKTADGTVQNLGFELFYEKIRNSVLKGINQIIREWRADECARLAVSGMAELRRRAMLLTNSDSLLATSTKAERLAWIEKIVNDQATSEADKKDSLAMYILVEPTSESQK